MKLKKRKKLNKITTLQIIITVIITITIIIIIIIIIIVAIIIMIIKIIIKEKLKQFLNKYTFRLNSNFQVCGFPFIIKLSDLFLTYKNNFIF